MKKRYTKLMDVGDGTYGTVFKARNNSTGQMVAIKKMKQKFYSWDECVKLREVQSLKKLKHPNIVSLKEVIRENDELFFIFEFVSKNILQMLKESPNPVHEDRIRKYMFQIIKGLEHMHKQGYFHRDMKPENLLLGTDDNAKIADFGLAREIRSMPPFTEYVSTRWYRAPEVLLRSGAYNSPTDMWACGAIMAEMYNKSPLFPGSNETDQLFKICSVMGTPSKDEWEDGHKLAGKMKYTFPKFTKTSLNQLIPTANANALDVMNRMMAWNPDSRPSAAKATQHPFFKGLNLSELNKSSGVSLGRSNNLPTAVKPYRMNEPTDSKGLASVSSNTSSNYASGSGYQDRSGVNQMYKKKKDKNSAALSSSKQIKSSLSTNLSMNPYASSRNRSSALRNAGQSNLGGLGVGGNAGEKKKTKNSYGRHALDLDF